MRLDVDPRVHLTELRPDDRETLVQHLNDREIYDCTLAIPYPYGRADAESFLAGAIARAEFEGRPLDFAMRGEDGRLIGTVGLHGHEPGHRAEVGYWLARPFWGGGIMTAVLRRVCGHAFEDLGLVRLTAHVFTFNAASCRVLEKVGFEREGLLRRHYRKSGKLIDAYAYGRLHG